MRRALTLALVFACVGAAATYLVARARRGDAPADAASVATDKRASPAPLGEPNDLRFQLPSGGPTRITCNQARRVIAQVRAELSYEPEAVSPKELSASASDWLDPHSFWSLPDDAPTSAAMDEASKDLIGELEGRGSSDCAAARRVGKVLAEWAMELRGSFDTGSKEHGDVASAETRDLPATGTSHERAMELGRRTRAVRAAIGEKAEPFTVAARDRFFPALDASAWAEVVLASAVRAYVPLVDPHGAWAPLDEKSSVYEVDLFAAPPEKPWGKVTVTAVGFRVDDHAVAPLLDNDVVLSVNGVLTAGMPLEQVEQLGFASRQDGAAKIRVIRSGALVDLAVGPTPLELANGRPGAAPHVEVTRIPFGSGTVAVVAFQDVRDDLGDDIRDVITDLLEEHVTGLVLDLRGNGGGSTDGAINALGHFIPNAPLFPTRRRDGTIEVDHSPANQPAWEGPVATLVDGSTASAAEMISGALMAYGRGPSVGAPTFGKGCAQEYLDDEAAVGVLRLTTLLYALPDGSPVQRVGLTPTIPLPFIAKMDDPHEREAKLPHTAPTWRGPDKRAGVVFARKDHWSWPQTTGKVGPCDDPDVCHALRALGARRPQIAKSRPDPR